MSIYKDWQKYTIEPELTEEERLALKRMIEYAESVRYLDPMGIYTSVEIEAQRKEYARAEREFKVKCKTDEGPRTLALMYDARTRLNRAILKKGMEEDGKGNVS